MKWRVIYIDGEGEIREASSDEMSPEDVPIDGVQRFLLEQGEGEEIVEGHDYYIWLGDRWGAGSRADLERWIRAGYVKPGLVKFGLYISNEKWKKIVG